MSRDGEQPVRSQHYTIGWYNGWSPAERVATLPVQREALRSGRIASPATCSICGIMPNSGSNNPVWLHDENYAAPLLAYHVCRSCHRILHERFDDPEPWRALVRDHGTGRRWFEALTMDSAALRRPFGVTYPNGPPHDAYHDPPDGTSLS